MASTFRLLFFVWSLFLGEILNLVTGGLALTRHKARNWFAQLTPFPGRGSRPIGRWPIPALEPQEGHRAAPYCVPWTARDVRVCPWSRRGARARSC